MTPSRCADARTFKVIAMNLLIFLTHPEPTRSGYEKYLKPRHPELTINTVATRDEALKLAPGPTS